MQSRKSLSGLGLAGLVVLCAPLIQPARADVALITTADAFAQSNDTGNGTGGYLVIKRDSFTSSTYHRKTWLKFDSFDPAAITARSGRNLAYALDLPFITPSEFFNGTTSSTTPWTFHVYGITDDSLDSWTESGFTWSTAPANDTSDGNTVVTASTADLGTFVRYGDGVGTEQFMSTALDSFVSGQTNSINSFILVRDTPAGANFAHTIASRERSGSIGSTLNLVERGNRLQANSEFENADGTFTTSGWANGNSVAGAQGGLIAGSKQAAFLDSSKNGELYDTVGLHNSNFAVDLYFATTGGANSGDRGFNVQYNFGSGQINLRVNGAGQVQVYNDQSYGGSSGWQTVADLGDVLFSVDADGNLSFSDVGDTLNVYRLKIETEDWGTANAAYKLLLSDANGTVFTQIADGLKFFQFAAPTTASGKQLSMLQFETLYGTGNFAVDSVYVQSIPEPTTLALGAIAAAGLMIRRRRA